MGRGQETGKNLRVLNIPHNFYIDDFPQPVYKKFDNREDADKFVSEHTPKETSCKIMSYLLEEFFALVTVDEASDHFYAVARGKVVGVFTDYNDVKKHVRL